MAEKDNKDKSKPKRADLSEEIESERKQIAQLQNRINEGIKRRNGQEKKRNDGNPMAGK